VKSKRKAKPSHEPTRKAGNQGNFHGPRKAFLEALLPSYLAAVQSHKIPTFWTPTYGSFHERFDWRINLKDPYPEDPQQDDANLDEEEIELKSQRCSDINKVWLCLFKYAKSNQLFPQKIYSFFSHQKYKTADTSNRNPFSTWLTQLRKPIGPAPRAVQAHKYYMSHEDYESKVNEAFDIEWPAAGLPKSHQLDFRCKIAKRLFDEEPLGIRTMIEGEVKEAHEAAHASAVRAEPTEDPEDQDL